MVSITLPQQRVFGVVLAILFTLLFLIFYGSSSLLSEHIPWHIIPALPFEQNLPLLPAWSIIYLSMPLLLLYGVVRLHWTEQWGLFAILVIELLFACFCFLLLPVQLSYSTPEVHGIWQDWFHIATTLSMDNNHLPSLHVAFACTAGIALHNTLPYWQRPILWIWIILIALSTLLIHEHHLIDIITGILLSFMTQKPIYSRSQQPNLLQKVRLEWLWWYNQWLFARRHRRYATIAIIIATQRLLHPQRGQLLLSGYCFLQAVDDLMDGDRQSIIPPSKIAETLLTAWQHKQFNTTDDLQLLAQDFYNRLLLINNHTAIDEVYDLLKIMYQDYRRSSIADTWTEQAIQQQLHQTFSLSLNLLLSAVLSQTRAEDVPELIHALGWCSVMRDLPEDLQNGIINIPKHLLTQTPLTLSNYQTIEQLLQQTTISTWLKNQHQQTLNQLKQLDIRLQSLPLDKPAQRIINLFSRSVRQFAEQRFPKQYPWIHIKTKKSSNHRI